MNKSDISIAGLAFLSMAGYFFIGHGFIRSDFWPELAGFSLCFVVYLLFNFQYALTLNRLLFIGLIFRLVFIWGEPRLSDDYYRFIWDAKLVANGENPYEKIPKEYFSELMFEQNTDVDLLFNLNSPHYYSVYPPLQQLFFLPAASASDINTSILILRLFVLAGELLLFYFLVKSIEKGMFHNRVLPWIWLNPLWIIEVNGNLHYEGWMITFLMIGIYFLYHHAYALTVLFFALSASLKMIPLILIPVVNKFTGFTKAFRISSSAFALFLIFSFSLFVSSNLSHYLQSVDLYYHKFEFNASFYFLVRKIGFMLNDTHPIVYGSSVLMGIFLAVYTFLIFKKDKHIFLNYLRYSALMITFYYLMSTTVHPWYILTVLFLSVLSGWYFGIVWSGLVFLSYSAYSGNEDLYYLMVATEYVLLFAFMFLELKKINFLRANEAA